MINTDIKNLNDQKIKKIFLYFIKENNYVGWRKLILQPHSKHIILADKDLMHLSLLMSLKHVDNKAFYSLYDTMVKQVIGFSQEALFDIFNAACYHNNIDAIRFLDQKINLSSYMLKQPFSKTPISIAELNNFEVLLDPPNNFTYYVDSALFNLFDIELQNNQFKHGLAVACFKGYEKIVNYLLAQVFENHFIHPQLPEVGLILAINHNKQHSLITSLSTSLFTDSNLENYLLLSNYYDYCVKHSVHLSHYKEKYLLIDKIVLHNSLHEEMNDNSGNSIKKHKI